MEKISPRKSESALSRYGVIGGLKTLYVETKEKLEDAWAEFRACYDLINENPGEGWKSSLYQNFPDNFADKFSMGPKSHTLMRNAASAAISQLAVAAMRKTRTRNVI